ncbi:dUTP diphosphatase [Methylobacterium oxalidis]|uniref:dUTP diphosphatase n=1 Tax=Methylobacterium oxalidis TaxID=944322 RepID=A0A512J071_9HYPH|nr:dUTP diphosphatase [Methylobacterium oxalidis]GEP03347.1 deoxyuridine 5'-triphosphate nucleotidohydrolase [Methylobacterium oxalidis]GJE31626.1 Deoxyuridine 5'-triphosphate nucleotidohydrolase [Methylobacterium oxalidis]GLS64147.1 deoxyuridine 5'-triphosphate nucleotidohydrolase [Methylobacterium oxalidis]
MSGPPLEVGLRLLDPRLPAWGFPRWGSPAAAGLDLHACLDGPLTLEPQSPPALIPAGIVVAIRDPDWCGLVLPRSGFGHREGLVLGNGTGVIDADYEGPLLVSAWNRNPAPSPGIRIEPGDRIAQLVFTRVTRPRLVVEAEAGAEQPASARGSGGFGSSGRR